MWSSNFVKHLSCTLTTRNFHKLSSFPRFVFFFTKAPKQPAELTKPTSTWFSPNISASLSSLASSETSQTKSYVSPYLSVDIRCHKDVVDMLSEALLCFGANSTSIDEKDTDESSDEIYINSIFPEGHDINSCISHAADSIGLKELPSYEVRVGEQYDWIKKTQESFNPVKVAEGLWIVPEWKTPLDLQATNIILNPGLAFGTGEHATTKLCLLLLHGLIKGGEHFLDYGTGSGILAIAALKFGAALSVGTDIDPQAIACARENAALNDIGPEKMHLHLIPETTSPGLRNLCGIPETENLIEVMPETEKFDVVVANILLNPLLDLAENIVSYAKPGAVIGVSGILSEQVPYIMERYSQFLEGISVSEMDDWACEWLQHVGKLEDFAQNAQKAARYSPIVIKEVCKFGKERRMKHYLSLVSNIIFIPSEWYFTLFFDQTYTEQQPLKFFTLGGWACSFCCFIWQNKLSSSLLNKIIVLTIQ